MRERVYKRRTSIVGGEESRTEPRTQALLNKMAESGAILHLPARLKPLAAILPEQ